MATAAALAVMLDLSLASTVTWSAETSVTPLPSIALFTSTAMRFSV